MSNSKRKFSRSLTEKLLRQIGKDLESKKFDSIEKANEYIKNKYIGKKFDDNDDPNASDAEKAQDLVYEAWDIDDTKKIIRLAEKALQLDENCADAYCLLAENKAETLEQAKEYYLKGIEAGKKSLGEKFEEYKGSFWGHHETRPFMRAMNGYANILWMLKEKSKAIQIMKEMIQLNPNDNQGIRHLLLTKLLIMNRLLEAEKLMSDYEDDGSVEWHYSKAYLYFNKRSKSFLADDAFKEAMEYNSYVLQYLLGKREIPSEMPEYISPGDKDEAISYLNSAIELWVNNKKALIWIMDMYRKYESELELLIQQRERDKRERFGESCEDE